MTAPLPKQALGASRLEAIPRRATHFPAKARRVIQTFAVGGMSHLDRFDYKSELRARVGMQCSVPTFFGLSGNLRGCPWPSRQHGLRGSGRLPRMAKKPDKLTLVRSMVSKSANHMPAVAQLNTGFILTGFPAMGA